MALVVPGAPVSVLLDHGLTEEITGKLMEGGVTTVEKLGEMTPEQVERIPGIAAEMVEPIQQAVMNYYGQFETSVDGAAGSEEAEPPVEAVPESAEAPTEGPEAAEPQEQSVTMDTEK